MKIVSQNMLASGGGIERVQVPMNGKLISVPAKKNAMSPLGTKP